jgi:CubicO group peptidase (beta-lactamase class C family)
VELAGLLRLIEGEGLGGSGTAVAARGLGGKAFVVSSGELGPGRPVEVDSVMYGASLVKQMIGVLVALLVDEGSLDVDLPLRMFLPNLPTWAAAISLRHLLHHTSGLPSTAMLLSYLGSLREQDWDNRLVLDALSEQSNPACPPGLRFEYSNVGYICLSAVIEEVTTHTLPVVARRRLFDPLKMGNSQIGEPPPTLVVADPAPPRTLGDGGLWTTAEDLLRWNDALNACHFGSSIGERTESTGHLADGTPLDYAWGIRVTIEDRVRTLTHGGSWPGWRSKIVRQPSRQISVALLTSCDDDQSVSSTAMRIARWLVDHREP